MARARLQSMEFSTRSPVGCKPIRLVQILCGFWCSGVHFQRSVMQVSHDMMCKCKWFGQSGMAVTLKTNVDWLGSLALVVQIH